MKTTREMAIAARSASVHLGTTSVELRNSALHAMAEAILAHEGELLASNQKDVDAARLKGTSDSLIDRLMLNPKRVSECADALRQLALAGDPLGEIIEGRTIAGGIEMKKVRVPLGVVGMIYEARPNVTIDAAGIGIKTGNAMILRGGSMALHSNAAIVAVLRDAVELVGLSRECIQSLDASDRTSAEEMMGLTGLIDVLIPRGGAGLIKSVVENSKVPVIETGSGNCHVYVHESADLQMAQAIIINAKCQRPSVCNAIESLLIDRSIADAALPMMLESLIEQGVEVRGEQEVRDIAPAHKVLLANDDDWGEEYGDLKISVKLVSGVEEAVAHINRYGTKHSEAIVTSVCDAADYFTRHVDAAAVYVNASTRFTDGAMFGLGAEIGISTQKLHARGPMGLSELTSSKFILHGQGQVR